jgi:hypothetical protein
MTKMTQCKRSRQGAMSENPALMRAEYGAKLENANKEQNCEASDTDETPMQKQSTYPLRGNPPKSGKELLSQDIRGADDEDGVDADAGEADAGGDDEVEAVEAAAPDEHVDVGDGDDGDEADSEDAEADERA